MTWMFGCCPSAHDSSEAPEPEAPRRKIGLMPVSMVLSGLASAFIFAPSLLLVSDLVRRGNGEGLFGIFQIAGSLGFLLGPMVGGILVAVTGGDGRPAYEAIFMMVGVAELGLALGTMALRRGFAIRQA